MITQSEHFNIRAFNTFGINAQCDCWIEFTEASDLPVVFASMTSDRYRCIGQGSNMLFVNDYHGTLLHSRILDFDIEHRDADMLIRIGSGMPFDDVVSKCCEIGYWGIENLSGIPGDAGAAAVQNIGAYGVEIKDVLVKVEAYDTVANKFVDFSNDACQYAYRHSVFKDHENAGRYVVTHITIKVTKNGGPLLNYGNLKAGLERNGNITPMDVRKLVIETRNAKLPDPTKVGSAGSFFKNPVVELADYNRISTIVGTSVPHYPMGDKVKIPAAWLIEQCGWKGRTIGNAGVWHLQPLVLVNATGRATGEEILALEGEIVRDVKEKFGIILHPEADHIY